jgi:hypothetical protein
MPCRIRPPSEVSVRRTLSIAVSTAGLLLIGAAPAVACPDHSPEAESLLGQVFGAVISVVS